MRRSAVISVVFGVMFFILISTDLSYAAGLFRIGKCTVTMVAGKGNDTCVKMPVGCEVLNMEGGTQKAVFPQIDKTHEMIVVSGELVACGPGDYYGTKKGTKIKDKETGEIYHFDTKLNLFIK